MEDLSGLEPGPWISGDAIPETLGALLSEVGRVYPPFLLANARALEQGAERVETQIDGKPWTQKPFPYQAKCLRWLREAHAGLSEAERTTVDTVLAGTGCEGALPVGKREAPHQAWGRRGRLRAGTPTAL